MPSRRPPFWLWPNLLSLDAPLVALSWLYMFAQAWRVNYLPKEAYWALGLGVWVIYVLDRLIDLRVRDSDDPLLGVRHQFHKRFRVLFVLGILVSVPVILWIVFGVLPMELVVSYAGPGVVMVVIFFLMVIGGASDREIPHFRNLVAGIAFGYGTAMIAHIYVPTERVFPGMVLSREMLSFGVLCVLNISAIHLWEHSRMSDDPEIKAADELSLTLPLTLLGGTALYFAYNDNPGMFGQGIVGADSPARPFFYAILVSAALLYWINRHRERFSMDALRCLADLAMVIPLPLFFVFAGDSPFS